MTLWLTVCCEALVKDYFNLRDVPLMCECHELKVFHTLHQLLFTFSFDSLSGFLDGVDSECHKGSFCVVTIMIDCG